MTTSSPVQLHASHLLHRAERARRSCPGIATDAHPAARARRDIVGLRQGDVVHCNRAAAGRRRGASRGDWPRGQVDFGATTTSGARCGGDLNVRPLPASRGRRGDRRRRHHQLESRPRARPHRKWPRRAGSLRPTSSAPSWVSCAGHEFDIRSAAHPDRRVGAGSALPEVSPRDAIEATGRDEQAATTTSPKR